MRGKPKILISGAAAITSLGRNRRETWQAILAGTSGIGPMPAIESPLDTGDDGGQAHDISDEMMTGPDRTEKYMRRAILDAIADAGFIDSIPYAPARCGIILGTTLGGMRFGGEFLRSGNPGNFANAFPAATMANAIAELDINGLMTTTSSACASGLSTVALGITLLQTGKLDLVLAGGYDPISEFSYSGFRSLRLVSEGPLRPMTKDRTGMKVAEGYGIVLLERMQDAHNRNWRGFAQVVGHGETSDAHHLTQPSPDGSGASRAIEEALSRANLKPTDISMIAAHATSTPNNDAAERAAYCNVFEESLKEIPLVSFKSFIGHSLGAAGAIELILSGMAIEEQCVPTTKNVRPEMLEFPEIRMIFDQPLQTPLQHTLNVSLGFGGANACLILSSPEEITTKPTEVELSEPSLIAPRKVCITGVGIVLPDAIGNEAFKSRLEHRNGFRLADSLEMISDDQISNLINARKARRLSAFSKLLVAAGTSAMQDAQIEPGSASDMHVVVGSQFGAAEYSALFYQQVIDEGINAGNPLLFAESVPNVGSAQLSLLLGLQGASFSLVGARTNGLEALHIAAACIASGRWDRVIVAAAEESYDTLINGHAHFGLRSEAEGSLPFDTGSGFLNGPGAVAIILETEESAKFRGVDSRGTLLSSATERGTRGDGRGLTKAVSNVLDRIGTTSNIMTSANGTVLDRIERAGIRRCIQSESISKPEVSSIYGYMAETFSVMPLASMAAVLLTGRMPHLLGPARDLGAYLKPAHTTSIGAFSVLCTDITGIAASAHLTVEPRANQS
ncbi:MAG: beta-ketoacyl-[acyl-carrier-protein] synthase family protein [Phycisphaerales bacterium]|nr:beta-ketoacyl-[acyl-carrier-protein] synthase family protein [Phycisphaerales bacterium]